MNIDPSKVFFVFARNLGIPKSWLLSERKRRLRALHSERASKGWVTRRANKQAALRAVPFA